MPMHAPPSMETGLSQNLKPSLSSKSSDDGSISTEKLHSQKKSTTSFATVLFRRLKSKSSATSTDSGSTPARQSSSTASIATQSSSQTLTSAPVKDYASAFGSLQSSYGFGGAAPTNKGL